MRFSPGLFGALLTGLQTWSLKIGDSAPRNSIVISENREERTLRLSSVLRVCVEEGMVWASLRLETTARTFELDGLTNEVAHEAEAELCQAVAAYLAEQVVKHEPAFANLTAAIERLLGENRYLASSDVTLAVSSSGDIGRLLQHPLFSSDELPEQMRAAGVQVQQLLAPGSDVLLERNERFVARALVEYAEFFDTIETRPLTVEQRRAAVIFDDRNLVVAAAGSGKTSLLVAKTGYAIASGFCQPDEILVLAFNRDAQQELAERINSRLGTLVAARAPLVKTFHALGVAILAEAEDRKPLVSKLATDGEQALSQFIGEAICTLASEDAPFRKDWLRLASLYAEPAKSPDQFRSRQEFEDYERQFRVKGTGFWGYPTLRGDVVKSRQEAAICNWLHLEGIDYEYERAYEFDTADRDHRQYLPDFYYPATKTYHEHFALDATGTPPPFFEPDYVAGVRWKRDVHAIKKTDFFETTSAMFNDGTWEEVLRNELDKRQVPRRTRSRDEERVLAKRLAEEHPRLMSLMASFLKHVKSRGITRARLTACADDRAGARGVAFVRVFWPIFERYRRHLADTRAVDFEDLVIQATEAVAGGRFRRRFRLILVDEFQDISHDRAALVNALLAANSGSRLCAVGDDFQAIYRFAGADLSLMTRFEDHFGLAQTLYLTQTFRCHPAISAASTRFILENPGQLRKAVTSVADGSGQAVRILSAATAEGVPECIEAMLARLNAKALERGETASVMLLGRYRRLQPARLAEWAARFVQLRFTFLTIHRAKGLEADAVFVLGVDRGALAFPSAIEDDPLLSAVLPVPEEFAYAEERRLFYVALTRARRVVFVVTRAGMESPFVRELQQLEYAAHVHTPGAVGGRSSERERDPLLPIA